MLAGVFHSRFKGRLDYLWDVILPSSRGSGPPIRSVNDHPVRALSAVKNWRTMAGHSSTALQGD